VTSLDLLAFPVRWSPRLVVAAIDARRGEVFTASYRQVPRGIQRLGEFKVCSPDELVTDLLMQRDDILLVGDGALRYADQFEDLTGAEVADQGLAYPSPASLVQLAHAQALREEFVKPWELQPLYLRAPDAAINWATRDGVVAPDESDSAAFPEGEADNGVANENEGEGLGHNNGAGDNGVTGEATSRGDG
jgi:tRNA threonylcarbamoyladenosine biosynthesis protein TsaB